MYRHVFSFDLAAPGQRDRTIVYTARQSMDGILRAFWRDVAEIREEPGARMNTETGQIYRSEEEILLARARGEPIVRVSNHVAAVVTLGQRQLAKRKRKQATKDRKRTKSKRGKK